MAYVMVFMFFWFYFMLFFLDDCSRVYLGNAIDAEPHRKAYNNCDAQEYTGKEAEAHVDEHRVLLTELLAQQGHNRESQDSCNH